jgi:dihydrofolate reductase
MKSPTPIVPGEKVRGDVSDPVGGVRSKGERPPARGADEELRRGKGFAIMKLTITTQVSVDGVMQGNGPSEQDRKDGFERDGWATTGHFGDESGAFVGRLYQRAEAFLFGRRTYDMFAPYWGAMDPGSGPIADALNTKPKYVASNTLADPRWAGTTVLSGDLAAAVGELKAKPGGELQVHGSGVLARWLLANGLVDELNLLTVPVVVGQGTRLFPDSGPDLALDLVESRAFRKGVTLQVYRPNGRPRYGLAGS